VRDELQATLQRLEGEMLALGKERAAVQRSLAFFCRVLAVAQLPAEPEQPAQEGACLDCGQAERGEETQGRCEACYALWLARP
jgi:hypothetical protein